MIKIILGNSAETMEQALSEHDQTATIEAVYGDKIVHGSVLTLTRGKNRNRKCPCLFRNLDIDIDAIGISRVDLNTIGGLMAILEIKQINIFTNIFWDVVAQIDRRGPHHIRSITWKLGVGKEIRDVLNAYYAFFEKHKTEFIAPEDGSVIEINIDPLINVLNLLLTPALSETDEYTTLINDGKSWYDRKKDVEHDSFRKLEDGVLLRVSVDGNNVNNLYNHYNDVERAIVGYDETRETITLSVESPIPRFSCIDFIINLFGVECVGNEHIAQSPCDKKMKYSDAEYLHQQLIEYLKNL